MFTAFEDFIDRNTAIGHCISLDYFLCVLILYLLWPNAAYPNMPPTKPYKTQIRVRFTHCVPHTPNYTHWPRRRCKMKFTAFSNGFNKSAFLGGRRGQGGRRGFSYCKNRFCVFALAHCNKKYTKKKVYTQKQNIKKKRTKQIYVIL